MAKKIPIERIRDTIFDVVRKSLYYAHKEYLKSEEDKRIVRKDIL